MHADGSCSRVILSRFGSATTLPPVSAANAFMNLCAYLGPSMPCFLHPLMRSSVCTCTPLRHVVAFQGGVRVGCIGSGQQSRRRRLHLHLSLPSAREPRRLDGHPSPLLLFLYPSEGPLLPVSCRGSSPDCIYGIYGGEPATSVHQCTVVRSQPSVPRPWLLFMTSCQCFLFGVRQDTFGVRQDTKRRQAHDSSRVGIAWIIVALECPRLCCFCCC